MDGANPSVGAAPGRLRFPRDRRLLLARDFLRAREQGFSLRDQVLRLGFFDRADGAPARLGLAVSRRNGNAVARNRIKRIAREAFRLKPQRFPNGWDVVVIPMDARRAKDLSEVVASLDRLAARLVQSRGRSGPSASP